MMAVREATQVIYLDTKDWIELARGCYGLTPELQKTAQDVVEKSASRQAIFPLSLIHFSEPALCLRERTIAWSERRFSV
jgi:hypothetical protein